MKKIFGVAVLAAGVAMLVLGFQSKGSWDSKVNEVFQGSANKRTVWLLAGGAGCAVAGVALVLLKDGKSK